MKHDVKKSVWDAMMACQAIQDFTEGQTLEGYRADLKLRSAVERQFEILGEAFNRIDDVDPLFRGRLPEMGDAIGMRNRISHGYDRVRDATVLDVAKMDVPILRDKLIAWLNENGWHGKP